MPDRRKRLLVVTLLVVGWMASTSAAAPAVGESGTISGLVVAANRRPLEGYQVQVRDVVTGQLIDRTITKSAGEWSFAGLLPATYVLEAVDGTGKIAAVSSQVVLGTDLGVTGVILVVRDDRNPLAAFFSSTPGIVALAAASSGIVAGIVTSEPASGSQ